MSYPKSSCPTGGGRALPPKSGSLMKTDAWSWERGLDVKPLNPINDAEREKKDGAMPQVGHEDALRDGAFRRRRVEQVPRHVREIGCLCQGGVPEGAVLRQDIQGRYGGQGLGGLLHQAVGFPCPVPLHRHELQSGR